MRNNSVLGGGDLSNPLLHCPDLGAHTDPKSGQRRNSPPTRPGSLPLLPVFGSWGTLWCRFSSL